MVKLNLPTVEFNECVGIAVCAHSPTFLNGKFVNYDIVIKFIIFDLKHYFKNFKTTSKF